MSKRAHETSVGDDAVRKQARLDAAQDKPFVATFKAVPLHSALNILLLTFGLALIRSRFMNRLLSPSGPYPCLPDSIYLIFFTPYGYIKF